jgi:hypothetical protein
MAKQTSEQIVQDTTEALARSGEAVNEVIKGNANALTESGNEEITSNCADFLVELRGFEPQCSYRCAREQRRYVIIRLAVGPQIPCLGV